MIMLLHVPILNKSCPACHIWSYMDEHTGMGPCNNNLLQSMVITIRPIVPYSHTGFKSFPPPYYALTVYELGTMLWE